MSRRTKRLALHLLKFAGVFTVSRRLTGGGLRILGDHWVAADDEHHFQGMLFISRNTFEDRIDWLCRRGYPVLGLEQALEKLQTGALPDGATVLTFDDGWHGTYESALRRFGLDRDPMHLCYPSGEYSPAIWDAMHEAGIVSATTCESGFNYPSTHRFALRRFLDADYYSTIEFEAEMCGFLELMRRLRNRLKSGSHV